jgi:hypothetical protein
VYSYEATGLINGTTYYFVVKATNAGGASAFSNEVSATPQVEAPEPSGPSEPPPSKNEDDGVGGSDSPDLSTTQTTQELIETDVDIIVNGKAERAGTATTEEVNGQMVTSVVVDGEKLEQRLETESAGAVITIAINTGSDVVVWELNGQTIKSMEDKQMVLEIKTETASYTLPAQQININALFKQLGQTAALKDIRIQIEIAAPKADIVNRVEHAAENRGLTLVVTPIHFTIKGKYGETTVDISKFNAYVKRTLALPDRYDPNQVTTGVVFDSDGTVRHVPTSIVFAEGKYYAVISSLTNSTYAVVRHPLEFSDATNHWAKNAVNEMGSRMIIDGTGNGLFSPDRDITRAEFAAIIVRGLGLELENGASDFSDVKTGEWYESVIHTASSYQLISGFEDGTFRPNDKITREQAMVIIAKAMTITNLKAGLPVKSTDAIFHTYEDAAEISTWARGGVADCVQSGLVSGKSGKKLAPKDFMTRAEVATIVDRLLRQSKLI